MKKKNLLILLIAIAFIGFTFAFMLNSSLFDNLFKTSSYGSSVTDEFVSPSGWKPGDTTTKRVVVNNEGNSAIAVRLKYSEIWHSTQGEDVTDINNVINDIPAAVINRTNTNNWIKDGDYYYYYKRLSNNESTTAFMDSVTFNSEIELSYGCANSYNSTPSFSSASALSTEEDNVKCIYAYGPYTGATYVIDFDIETIQYDAYEEAWGTSVTIE